MARITNEILFSISNGEITNPAVGELFATIILLTLLFSICSFLATFGIKGAKNLISNIFYAICKNIFEIIIFFYIFFKYKRSGFFKFYKKRRNRVLRKVAHKLSAK